MQDVPLDQTLVEFEGDLREVMLVLDKLDRGYASVFPPADDPYWESSEVNRKFLALLNRLNAKSPEGYYFGQHVMDPSCFGFWSKDGE